MLGLIFSYFWDTLKGECLIEKNFGSGPWVLLQSYFY
jgi:hypothetical protein